MSLWKYIEIFDILRQTKEREDPNTDKSFDVKTNEYPNYDVITNYNYRPEAVGGYNILFGGSYGFLFGVGFGIPYVVRKYKRLGYTDNWKLLEAISLPMLKSVIFCTVFGVAVGALYEIKRMANRESNPQYYNKKVF